MAKLINGNGNPAIYANQDADLIAALAGNTTGIAKVGSEYSYTQEDANTIGLADGVIVTKEGRRIQLDEGQTDLFSIPTGQLNVTNYYIIGYKLTIDAEGRQLCETFVQKMNSSTETITEDTLKGGATEVYVSVYRVTQVGLNINTVTLLLPKLTNVAALNSSLSTTNTNITTINRDVVWYGTSSTAAATAAKVASTNDSKFTLVTGAKVKIKFTYANTASAPTLNVDSKGAVAIKAYGTTAPSLWWSAGDVVEFTYDGTNFIMGATEGQISELKSALTEESNYSVHRIHHTTDYSGAWVGYVAGSNKNVAVYTDLFLRAGTITVSSVSGAIFAPDGTRHNLTTGSATAARMGNDTLCFVIDQSNIADVNALAYHGMVQFNGAITFTIS